LIGITQRIGDEARSDSLESSSPPETCRPSGQSANTIPYCIMQAGISKFRRALRTNLNRHQSDIVVRVGTCHDADEGIRKSEDRAHNYPAWAKLWTIKPLTIVGRCARGGRRRRMKSLRRGSRSRRGAKAIAISSHFVAFDFAVPQFSCCFLLHSSSHSVIYAYKARYIRVPSVPRALFEEDFRALCNPTACAIAVYRPAYFVL